MTIRLSDRADAAQAIASVLRLRAGAPVWAVGAGHHDSVRLTGLIARRQRALGKRRLGRTFRSEV